MMTDFHLAAATISWVYWYPNYCIHSKSTGSTVEPGINDTLNIEKFLLLEVCFLEKGFPPRMTQPLYSIVQYQQWRYQSRFIY